MRNSVIAPNVLSVLAGLMIEPVALYVGIWGLLGPAYDRPQDLVLGVLVVLAPIAITALCMFLSIRRMRQGSARAPFIAAAPLILAVAAYRMGPFGPLR